MPPGQGPDRLGEIYRLTKENNEMLHRMRRNAFMGGVFKFLIYAVLFAAPIWFYMVYVSGTVDQMINTMNKIEGTGQVAQNKFSGFQDAVKQFEAKLPSFLKPSQSASSTAQ